MIIEDHDRRERDVDTPEAERTPVDHEETPEFRSAEEFAAHLAAASFREGIREWKSLIEQSIEKKTKKRRSYRTMVELGLIAVVAIGVALFRYSDLVESKLAVRAAAQPRRFFPSDSNVFDYFRGDGASYAELYNQADLTILLFYAPWSLHSMEARPHFVRLAASLRDSPNVRFVAVNCDVGQCKRSLKLYYYPVIVALTNANVAVIYEDSPTFDLLFSWVLKLMSPVHRVLSTEDPALKSTNYDRIALAYLPLAPNGELSREFNVFKLAAMRCKDRVLFCVTTDVGVAAHLGIHREGFKLLNGVNITHINSEVNSAKILEIIAEDLTQSRPDHVQWISRETDDEGGKSTRLHSLLNESGALVVLFTTPRFRQQTSVNLEHLRRVAHSYKDCNLQTISVEWSSNAAEELADLTRRTCAEDVLEMSDCCAFISHGGFCKKKSAENSETIQNTAGCSRQKNVFSSAKLIAACCQKKRLQLSFRQRMECRLHDQKMTNNPSTPSPNTLKSLGLGCQTNRSVNFVALDRRSSDYFLRIWNVNTSGEQGEKGDHLAIISLHDDAIFSTSLNGEIEQMDEFLAAFSNSSLMPTVLDEQMRGSFFSSVRPEVAEEDEHEDELCTINRLTARSFRDVILNDTNRTFSSIVFFSGGQWHGPSMAVAYILQTVKREFSAFDSLIRFFLIDVTRNSLPYAYNFDSLPALMFFPAAPFPQSQSSLFLRELPFSVSNLMAFILSRASPELRFRVALRSCSAACLIANRRRLHQFEAAVRANLRTLRWSKRRYTHSSSAKHVAFLLRKRRLQLKAAGYLQNVLRLVQTHRSDGRVRLSAEKESLIVGDSLLLRWLIANTFGQNFNSKHSLEL